MGIKKLDYVGSAKKLKGDGLLKYCLWIDDKGSLYVQLIENEKAGTYSDIIFSVSKYLPIRNSNQEINVSEGYDTKAQKIVSRPNNNNGAFLKAVLKTLLPEEV